MDRINRSDGLHLLNCSPLQVFFTCKHRGVKYCWCSSPTAAEVLLVKNTNSGCKYFRFDNSFAPFMRFLKQKQDNSIDIRVKFYRYLVKKFEQHPKLLVPFTDYTKLEEHDELVQLLRMSLLPLSVNCDEVPMALASSHPKTTFSRYQFHPVGVDVY